jgi:small-conductance mechanosensitive channel
MLKQLAYQYSERLSLALLVLIVAISIGYVVSLVIKQLARYKTVQANRVYRLLAGSVNTAIAIAGLISALGTLGVNITAMVAGLGLTGFAVGIALKDAVSNLVAGILIVIYKPFDLEESIEISGMKGRVVDINLRYVTLEQDSERSIIPNSFFVTNIIKIRTQNPPPQP